MATEATAGIGTSFRRWDGANWVHIAEIMNIGGSGKTRGTIEVVTLDTVDYSDFISSKIRDAGTVTFTMIFRRDTYEIMNDDFESDDLQNYEILLPDDELTSFEFEGWVTELPLPSTSPTEAITADVTIKISGETVINSGSGSSA